MTAGSNGNGNGNGRLLPVKLLLVDDHEENLLSLKAMLDRPDYELSFAKSGEEALHALLRNEYAVILMDVAMPGLDGFETARLIRASKKVRRVPIIFVTGVMTEAEQIYRGYTAGAVEYLLKPIDPHALKAKVAVFVELYRQAKEIERTSNALREAEKRERKLIEALYQDTFEEAPIGIGHVSVDGRWLRANSRLAELVGIPREKLLGRTLAEFVFEGDRPELDSAMSEVLNGQKPRDRGEYRIVHPDGSVAWTVLSLSTLRDQRGAPVQLTIMEDVTEEKRLALALVASEDRFRRLQESGLVGIFIEQEDGTITEANDAFLRMLHLDRTALESHTLHSRDLTPPEFRALDDRAREELAEERRFRAYDKELIGRDGRRVSVLIGGMSLDVPEHGVLNFVLDITERKELERERLRINRELQESIAARDDFLALAAHELRNPLTPLKLQVGRLRRTVKSGRALDREWLGRKLDAVDGAVARLTRLVEELLDASRLTVGQMPLERETVDLAHLVREVVERMRPELERAGCEVRLEGPETLRGDWDRLRLEQVIGNLLSNAAKYGAGKPIEITLSGDARSSVLTVRDHGVGIPPEQQKRIFRRFERIAPVRHFGGFGLGLWIVRQVSEALGGRVCVWSEPGQGAKFTVELPRQPPNHEYINPPDPRTYPPAGATMSGTMGALAVGRSSAASSTLVVSTGHGASRTTRSATLPASRCERPVRPWVPITMRSCLPSRAA